MEWVALKEDFDADFRRIRKADVDRMDGELSRDGDEAVASGDRVGLTAANNSYTSSFHSAKGQYQELLLQWEKAKKRSTAGGPTAGGGVAASRLVFEYCDLLFKVLREQWSCFQAHYQVLMLPGKGRAGAGRNAESEVDKAGASERKRASRLSASRRRPGRRSITRWLPAGPLVPSLPGMKRIAP
jgi:hypothetical protein